MKRMPGAPPARPPGLYERRSRRRGPGNAVLHFELDTYGKRVCSEDASNALVSASERANYLKPTVSLAEPRRARIASAARSLPTDQSLCRARFLRQPALSYRV